MRLEDLYEPFKKDLDQILQLAPFHIEVMMQVAMELAVHFKAGRSKKRITPKVVVTLLEFSQNLI